MARFARHRLGMVLGVGLAGAVFTTVQAQNATGSVALSGALTITSAVTASFAVTIGLAVLGIFTSAIRTA